MNHREKLRARLQSLLKSTRKVRDEVVASLAYRSDKEWTVSTALILDHVSKGIIELAHALRHAKKEI